MASHESLRFGELLCVASSNCCSLRYWFNFKRPPLVKLSIKLVAEISTDIDVAFFIIVMTQFFTHYNGAP